MFGKVIPIFENSMRELSRAVIQSNVSHYSTAPPSYFVTKKPEASEKNENKAGNTDGDKSSNSETRTKSDLLKKGWYQATDSFEWPKDLSCRPCNKFCQIGAACFRKPCTYVHKVFPDQFSDEDKKILVHFEANSPVFSFAPHVNYTLPPNNGNKNNQTGSTSEPVKKESQD